jgi:hypothetical protein
MNTIQTTTQTTPQHANGRVLASGVIRNCYEPGYVDGQPWDDIPRDCYPTVTVTHRGRRRVHQRVSRASYCRIGRFANTNLPIGDEILIVHHASAPQPMMRASTTEGAQILRWLHGATSHDSTLPALHGIHDNGPVLVATDGYQLRSARAPVIVASKPLPDTWVPIDANGRTLKTLPAKPAPLTVLPTTTPFPNWQHILPSTQPVFEITLSPTLLASLCKGLHQPLRLVFHGPTAPVEAFTTVAGAPAYALIMPMTNLRSPLTWRPYTETNNP